MNPKKWSPNSIHAGRVRAHGTWNCQIKKGTKHSFKAFTGSDNISGDVANSRLSTGLREV